MNTNSQPQPKVPAILRKRKRRTAADVVKSLEAGGSTFSRAGDGSWLIHSRTPPNPEDMRDLRTMADGVGHYLLMRLVRTNQPFHMPTSRMLQ